MDIKRRVQAIIEDTLRVCVERGDLDLQEIPSVQLEKPKRPEHGDFATTICLQLAKVAKKNPRDLAKSVLTHLVDNGRILESADMAGPGFINLRVRPEIWRASLLDIAAAGDDYGRSEPNGKRVLVEFVSANPTGPLHVGHGRGAVVGDAVSSLLSWAGWDVEREYYINDVGNQMNRLGLSLYLRYREACGHTIELGEDHYVGEYLIPLAEKFKEQHGDSMVNAVYDDDRQPWIDWAKDAILEGIREDLDALGVRYDRWFPESSLHAAGRLEGAVKKLEGNGHIFSDDKGTKWFRSSELGDDSDRVVIRETGVPTYFAADIAYHDEKLERGYDLLINVWGADHHGYVPRVKAAIAALGKDPDSLEILLVQFVSLLMEGQPVQMSTRSGQFETLSDLIGFIGADATRFNFIMRKTDAQCEFDLAQAKAQSLDNPVFYAQYGHARVCAVLAKAAEQGISVPRRDQVDLSPLTLPEELGLIQKIHKFPWAVRSAAGHRAPHFIVQYLRELSGKFHSYYTQYKHTERVVSDDVAKTAARLFLVDQVRQVLKNALVLLGVSTPERMYFTE